MWFIFALFGNILFIFQTQSLFFLGLAFFVFGTGLVIPNNASMIGALYDQDDSGRDKGYGLYYVASNVGGLLGPILFGYLGHYFGWVVSFIVCAISIVLWFILYLRNRHHLASKGNFEGDVKKHIFLPFLKLKPTLFITFILFSILIYFILRDSAVLVYVLMITLILGLGYLFMSMRKSTLQQKKNVLSLLFMMLFVLIFFSCEFQTLNSFILFMKNYVNLSIFNIPIPVSTFASAEPLFVILSTFVIVNPLSKYLGKRQPRYYTKLGIGTGIAGVGFLVFTFAAHLAYVSGAKISIWWMVLGVMLLALGELFVMPPLLAAISKLAPQKIKGTMMGLMYFAVSISGYLSGEIAKFTALLSRHKAAVLGYQITYFNLAIFMLILSLVTLIGVFYTRKKY